MPLSKLSGSRGAQIVHKGHNGIVYSVAFSPDGESVASGSMDRTIRIWDAHSPSFRGNPFTGHSHGVYSISYSPTSNLVASGSRDQSIRLWDINTAQAVGEPLQGHVGQVNAVAFSPGGKFIGSGSKDSTIRLWDVQNRSTSRSFIGHNAQVHSIGLSPDASRLISGSDDTTIRVWDIEHGAEIREPFRGRTGVVHSVCFSPQSSHIVSGSSGNEIQLWDVRSGKPASKPYEGHAGLVYSVSFSPNGLFLASGSYDQTIRIWDIRTGGLAIVPFEGHTGYVLSVAFSPSGKHIVSGSNDGTVMVWNTLGSGLDVTSEPEVSVNDRDHDDRGPRKGETVQRSRVDRHMTFKEMFELLLDHGCIDLSSKMDSTQNSRSPVSVGGFGEIWTSRLYDGTKVAIKVWRASEIEQCEAKALKHAAKEVYYWSRMNHPHVHQLRGVLKFRENCLGMVSEWMDNGNLREYIRKNDNVDRYEMCESIASGLEYMHRDNAIHGDLKAINVLVSSDGVAKLADFGLSTISGASLGFSDTSNPQIGTTRWAAPELVVGDASKSKESDVYALGMTMLEIITEEIPYPQCHSDYQVIAKIMKKIQPERPMTQLKDNNRDNQMWNLLVSCWSHEPVSRPSAQQVLESIRAIRALNK